MTDRELMQQALDALFMFVEYDYQGNPLGGAHFNGHKAIEALRARLAQPEPKREWQGLTDEEIKSIYDACDEWGGFEYERAIEAKLKEKNGF